MHRHKRTNVSWFPPWHEQLAMTEVEMHLKQAGKSLTDSPRLPRWVPYGV